MGGNLSEAFVRSLCDGAVQMLVDGGIVPEQLAALAPAKRALLWPKPARMRPVSEVWRLGVLLIGTDGSLYAAGPSTRAAERGRPGYQSESREERRDLAAAALRGGYAAGTPVNFDARLLFAGTSAIDGAEKPGRTASKKKGVQPAVSALSDPLGNDSPLGVADGEIRVRWRANAPLTGAMMLSSYLSERVELLVNPPTASM